MYRQNALLLGLLQPVISALGYLLWGIEESTDSRGLLLRIYIDHADGIALEDCERVSRQIVGVLDVEDPIPGAYHLEVSSPGLARPLFTLAQCRQFIGAQVRLRLRAKCHDKKVDKKMNGQADRQAGRRRLVGRIAAVEADALLISKSGEQIYLAADEIQQAHIVPQ